VHQYLVDDDLLVIAGHLARAVDRDYPHQHLARRLDDDARLIRDRTAALRHHLFRLLENGHDELFRYLAAPDLEPRVVCQFKGHRERPWPGLPKRMLQQMLRRRDTDCHRRGRMPANPEFTPARLHRQPPGLDRNRA